MIETFSQYRKKLNCLRTYRPTALATHYTTESCKAIYHHICVWKCVYASTHRVLKCMIGFITCVSFLLLYEFLIIFCTNNSSILNAKFLPLHGHHFFLRITDESFQSFRFIPEIFMHPTFIYILCLPNYMFRYCF